jgi:hypothetical protein
MRLFHWNRDGNGKAVEKKWFNIQSNRSSKAFQTASEHPLKPLHSVEALVVLHDLTIIKTQKSDPNLLQP